MNASFRFETAFLASFPIESWKKRRVCLAISGGADSVALLRAFERLARANNAEDNLFVVTVDHQSRGEESDGDVAFVQDLTQSLGLKCFVCKIDQNDLEAEVRRQGSWESAARTLRYQLLIETAQQNGARYLATAHHQDDQLETILFRLFRGSGFDGLRGIESIRVVDESLTIVRPLLNLSREDILEYLNELRQGYRIDSSNMSSKYARNRIRNELAPILDSIFPGKWQKSLLRLTQLSNATESYFDEQIEKLYSQVANARQKEDAYRRVLESINASATQLSSRSEELSEFPIEVFQNFSDEIVRRFFRKFWKEKNWPLGDMGVDEWVRIADAVKNRRVPNPLPGNILISFPNEYTIRFERKNTRHNT